VLLKAKGAETTVYVGFDSEQLEAFRSQLAEVRI
jgi:hypothetical protein